MHRARQITAASSIRNCFTKQFVVGRAVDKKTVAPQFRISAPVVLSFQFVVVQIVCLRIILRRDVDRSESVELLSWILHFLVDLDSTIGSAQALHLGVKFRI